MELHEKLQELRKSRGLTQEELAEVLYVSRTAVSKWESGRGYPSIDSLKAIASYFSVTIDELLSGEQLLSIAEQENRANIRSVCYLLFGIVDVCTFLLIVLPLYPNMADAHIYSVNLLQYTEAMMWKKFVYWILFLVLIALGLVKILLVKRQVKNNQKKVTDISMLLGIFTVLFLALAREVYAIVIAFLLLVIKGILLLKSVSGGEKNSPLNVSLK